MMPTKSSAFLPALPHSLSQLQLYLLRSDISFPAAKVEVHQLPLGKICWKHTPLTTRFDKIEDSIENLPDTVFALSVVTQISFYNLPLADIKVIWITLSYLIVFVVIHN